MPRAPLRDTVRARWRNNAMFGLLALMALGIFALPVAAPTDVDVSRAGDVVLLLILVVGIGAIREFRRMAALLSIMSAVLVVAWLVEPSIRWHGPLLAAALTVLAVAIGFNVFGPHRRVAERLYGAIALYLLLALIFGAIYTTIAAVVPDAFAGSAPQRAVLFDWGYFSLVTLTTVGYGDITPVARIARSIAALEALIGQLYPAIIIARLVSAQE